MKRMMLIGHTAAGKTTFCQAINHWELKYKKTQQIEWINNAIDTPGEYVENRNLYRALLVTAADADLIILLQDCTDDGCIFAPSFATMFTKPVIGLVTKIDLASDEKQIQRAEAYLDMAGCRRIFRVSNTEQTGLEEIKAYLVEQGIFAQQDE